MEPECEPNDAPVFFFESDQSNGFLSQAFLSSFEHVDIKFNCNEQFFQATNATFFIRDNCELYKVIMSATDPEEQKVLGKHIKADSAFWAPHRVTAGEL
ncbi:hypothetical protein IG631_09758 [Alternaria alternata]|nr:hypothetical protein IG631_09758 [Alternaria alternata]